MILPIEKQKHCQAATPLVMQQLIQDQLHPREASQWQNHLSECDACQRLLDETASDPRWWQETQQALSDVLPLAVNTEVSACEVAEAGSTHRPVAQELTRLEPAAHRMLVAWLEPSDNQQSIGRLGHFEVRRVVGHGGMGIVFEAWDTVLERVVAIKAMHPHLAAIGTARQRFIREARAAAAIVHPNVVPIHSVDANHQPPYLIMPMVHGETLQERIDRDGPISLEAALRIASQIAQGLSAAEGQGLTHRDVKPANILLELGTERALLTDFGVARVLDDAALTNSGTIAGTPEYMSPEQSRGEPVDGRSDQFSLGSVLYFMLVGHPPFRANSPMGVLLKVQEAKARPIYDQQPQHPAWVQVLLDRLHAVLPTHRFVDAVALSDVLRDSLAHVHQPQSKPLPSILHSKAKRGNLDRAMGIAACCASLVIGLGIGLLPGFPLGSQLQKNTPKLDVAKSPLTESRLTIAENARARPPFSNELVEWDPWDRLLGVLNKDLESLEGAKAD
jgi:eukaryotic-like serine/threonine-protein kinase